MTDNPFLQDVNAVLSKVLPPRAETFKKGLATLNERGVNSYNSLFSLMRNLDTDTDTLLQAYDVMYHLSSQVDKRRAVSPLMAALKSDNSRVRQQATWILGALKSKKAVPLLLEIVQNQNEDKTMRYYAIRALHETRDKRAMPVLVSLMTDPEEDTHLRTSAAEWLPAVADESVIPAYIEALKDDSADVRFEALYGMIQLVHQYDISSTLRQVDQLAAFNHVVPQMGHWHIDREALGVLEAIYWKKLVADDNGFGKTSYLISPAPEYADIQQTYLQLIETGYVVLPIPPVNLKVDQTWLAEQLQRIGAELNVRQPKPQAYLLDWKVNFPEGILIGGLHRDGYGVVLMGSYEAAEQFARWYRDVLPTIEKLYFYMCGDIGVEIERNAEV